MAESGINIEFNTNFLSVHKPKARLTLHREFDNNVVILKIFPSMNKPVVQSIFNTSGLKGVVLETYGSGNTMNYDWFIDILETAIKRGVIIYNVSQCSGGEVIQGRYETSRRLNEIGVLSGGDITTEAAVTKLMFLLGNEEDAKNVKRKLLIPLNGEMDT